MKKALHDEEKVFFSFRKGEISAWSTHDMETLLAAANDVPEYEVEERKGFQVLLKDGEVVLRLSPEEMFCQILLFQSEFKIYDEQIFYVRNCFFPEIHGSRACTER